jgi:hypothetical protein
MGAIQEAVDRIGPKLLGRRWVGIRHHPLMRVSAAVPGALRFRYGPKRSNVVLFDICSKMGMGAMLTHAVRLLKAAEVEGWQVRFAFTNPLYGSAAGEDWFDSFFVQREAPCAGVPGRRVAITHHWNYQMLTKHSHPTLAEGLTLFQSKLGFSAEVDAALARALAKLGSLELTVGVHYRGTDKMHEARLSSFAIMRQTIGAAILRTGFDTLFLATDEPAFETFVAEQFPELKILTYNQEGVTRVSGQPVHFSDCDGYAKGMEAVLLILLLARTGHLVRTPSYLSSWSQVLNPALSTFLVNPGALYSATFPDRDIIANGYAVIEGASTN